VRIVHDERHKLGEFAPTRTFRGHISKAEKKGRR
jgi:ribosomal protein S19